VGDWTGTVPTFAAGAKLRGVDMATLAAIDTALVTGWTTWVPTLTNMTLGSGTQIAKYRRLGKAVDFRWRFVYGAGSAVGTDPQFTLPVAAAAEYLTAVEAPFSGRYTDASVGASVAHARPIFFTSASNILLYYFSAAATIASITSTAPWTWTTSDSLNVWGTYYTD